MSNAVLRILTALIGIPVVLGLTYLGGWPFALLLLFAAVIAQLELYRLMEAGGLKPRKAAGLMIGTLVAVRALVPLALPLAVVGALFLLAASPFQREDRDPLSTLSATFFGALYPAALLTFMVDLRFARGPAVGDQEAFYLTLTTLLLIWATDTFAYYVGKGIGKHPLAPRVSPKKTWEGAIGGAAGAVLVAVVLKLTLLAFLPWPHLVVIALICGVVSQLGDLAESKLKRSVDVKDSGTILPGHGGLLDRFDALILAAPFVYLYLAYATDLFG